MKDRSAEIGPVDQWLSYSPDQEIVRHTLIPNGTLLHLASAHVLKPARILGTAVTCVLSAGPSLKLWRHLFLCILHT